VFCFECVVLFSFVLQPFYIQQGPTVWICAMRRHGVQNTKANPKFSRIILNDKTWDLLISPVSFFTPTLVFQIKNLMEPNMSLFLIVYFCFSHILGPIWDTIGTRQWAHMTMDKCCMLWLLFQTCMGSGHCWWVPCNFNWI
jgi:hypothetical protein